MNPAYSQYSNFFSLPGFIRFDVPSGGISVIRQTPLGIFVDVPADQALLGNPTKELFDRLGDLKKMYSVPWLPDSTVPVDDAFQNAKDFVLTLPLNQMSKPSVHVASDGEVNFHWVGPDFRIDLGFYGDGKFSYFGEKKGHAPVVGDEVPVQDGAPKALLALAV